MLDIIILFFLCQKIKYTVEPKGYRSGKWQLYAVLIWIGLELLGCTISILLGKSFLIINLSGMLLALGGGLMFLERVKKLPPKQQEDN